MTKETKDNITIVDTNNDNEVIAIIARDNIIIKDGYKAIMDVGTEKDPTTVNV